jgi:2,5-diamino-6-(ribosylamino)-4(3H)-pyrimidinone 5'-phosphate reductase
MIRRHQKGEGKQPWVVCSPHADRTKKAALEEQGVKIVEAVVAPKTGGSLSWRAVNRLTAIPGLLDLHDVLIKLLQLGIGSLMVEGGQKVISEFLSSGTVDCVIITVSPMWVGPDGLSAMCDDTVGEGQGS